MGDRLGTICIQRSLNFTSASSKMTFIRRKAMFWNTTGSDLVYSLITHRLFCKNYCTSQLVNKLSYQNKKKTMQTFSPDFNGFLRTCRRISGCLFLSFPPWSVVCRLHSAFYPYSTVEVSILNFTLSLQSAFY